MMKILFISHEASRTGAPFALLQELDFFSKHNKELAFEVLLLSGGPLMDRFSALCPVYKGWRDYNLSSHILRKFCRNRIDYPYLYLFRKGQFDVIYANTVASFKVAIELKKKYGISLIGHVHEAENLFCALDLDCNQLKEFDKLIAVSSLTANNLKEIYYIPSDKIVIQHPISYWIDNIIRNRVAINPVRLCPEKFLIGFFCNGGWWKAIELLPLVMKNFYEKHPSSGCEFVVVGDIDKLTRYHVEYDLRKMNVKRNIHWVGSVENPLDYHARFNLFLLLSHEESFSLAAQEAAFMETPVLGFVGATGATEWICKGAGSLVPYMDFDRISEEIYKYYVDEGLRKNVGKRAKEIVTDMYKNDSQMTNLLALLNG